MNPYSAIAPAFLLTLLLTACSEGTETGGGAGDDFVEPDPVAVALISPFAGRYELPLNWAGLPGSEAYLEIQTPNAAGEATAQLYRKSTLNNCFNRGLSMGEVVKDPGTNDPTKQRVFLNRVFELENSVLSLSDTTLIISLAEDIQDVDGDNDESEPAVLEAPRFNSDIQVCQQG